MHNNLCKVNVRFRDIARRLVSMLPIIYFSDGGELGIVSVRRLIKKFGSSSGVVLEVRRIIASPNWANARLEFGMVYHPQRIVAKTSKVAFC